MALKLHFCCCCIYLSLFLALGIWVSQVESLVVAEMSMVDRHEQWMAQYERVYMDANEKEKRFLIFKNNVERIESFNKAGDKPYKLGVNHFADLDDEEFKASLIGYMGSNSTQQRSSLGSITMFDHPNGTVDVPTSMDWREKGAVTPIKNQGKCGSDWAFSAVAAMEGIIQLKTGKLVSLSEQQIIDCDVSNNGCGGGITVNAFQFIQRFQGLTTEANYPHQATQGTCNMKQAADPIATIIGYEDVPSGSEQQLLIAVAKQPVSIALEGSGESSKFYKSGVFTGECGTVLNHAITLVGYGVNKENGTKYWLVKNSWGTGWGENGYMRIQRDVAAEEGLCGLAMQASYPLAAEVQQKVPCMFTWLYVHSMENTCPFPKQRK